MIIDTHGHMIPPDLLATIRKEGAASCPSLRIVEDPAGLSLAFGSGKPSRPIMKGLSDLTGRLAWMDKQGIDKQVNGGWPDWFGSDLPPDQGETWCRLMNEGLLVGRQGRAALRAALHACRCRTAPAPAPCSRRRWRRAFAAP